MPPPSGPITGLSVEGVMRLARCWILTLEDGTVYRITDHNTDLVVRGATFKSGSPSGSAAEFRGSIDPQNVSLRGFVTVDELTDDMLWRGALQGAKVQELRVDWRYPFAGVFYEQTYYIGDVKYNDRSGVWEADSPGLIGFLRNRLGRNYNIQCDARLGDPDTCGVNLATYARSCTVSSVSADGLTIAASVTPAAADAFFERGHLVWVSSANGNSGEESIKTSLNTGGLFFLQYPSPKIVAVGDTFTAYPGCNHLAGVTFDGKDDPTGHCKHKFNNLQRFHGFPSLPTNDRLFGAVSATE